MRLDKLLSDLGAGTRKELKKTIRSGAVLVNGTAVTDPGAAVDPSAVISYCGRTLQYEAFAYYMMNKPAGVISASEDPKQPTVLDLITEPHRTDLFPVGRLDKDTEGLLLITNDGVLAHRLLSPKHHVDKCYYARVDGRVTEADAESFAAGLELSDFTCLPADLEIISSGPESEVQITIREGKFHQIKRMFAARGMDVLYLKRLSMGPLALDPGLAPGEYRRLTSEELQLLKE